MARYSQTIESIEDGNNVIKVDGSWLSKPSRACYDEQQLPRMQKNMPLLSIIPTSAGQLRADMQVSAARVIFDTMLEDALHLINSAIVTATLVIVAFRGAQRGG